MPLSLIDRCSRCLLRREVCLCGIVCEQRLTTRLVLLMHWTEMVNTTNTGRLSALVLPNSEIRLRGLKEGPMRADGLVASGRRSLFLFPEEGAHVLDAAFLAKHPGPYTLIVPDGTWRQAAKVGRRTAELRDVLRVTVPEGEPTRYYLRKAPQPHCLSTIEAIARALGVLEGPAVRTELERLFNEMVRRTLGTRSPARRGASLW